MSSTADSKGNLVIGITLMFQTFATLAVGLRFWSLHIKRRKVFAHDIWIVIGYILTTCLSASLIVAAVHAGLGNHAAELAATPWKVVMFEKLVLIQESFWASGMTATRLSMLQLYLHLFTEAQGIRIACYVLMAASVLWVIGEFLLVFLICQPLAYNWDPTIHGTCGDIKAGYLSVHSFNLVLDFSIAVLPIPVLWKLRMPVARKAFIIAMFGIGVLICTIAIARIALWELALGYTSQDFTYSGTTLYIFSGIDVSAACTLACMPLLRPVTEQLASSPIISWMKTFSLRSTSRTSTLTKDGYLETGSTEGLQLGNRTIGGSMS